MKKYTLAAALFAGFFAITTSACNHSDASSSTEKSENAAVSSDSQPQATKITSPEQLTELAKQTSKSAEKVYTIQMTKMGDLATIFPTVELQVLKPDAKSRMVSVTGYQMEGAESVIYKAKGQRSIVAVVSEKGQSEITLGKASQDDYGNNWRPAALTGTIQDDVVDSQQALWQYADHLDSTYCSSCHAKIAPDHFTVNAWGPVAKSMGARTNMSKQDLQILTKYFESNAKDAVKK
ncbi:MAG: hypothetical protein ACK5NC_14195 [Vibrio sp.]